MWDFFYILFLMLAGYKAALRGNKAFFLKENNKRYFGFDVTSWTSRWFCKNWNVKDFLKKHFIYFDISYKNIFIPYGIKYIITHTNCL